MFDKLKLEVTHLLQLNKLNKLKNQEGKIIKETKDFDKESLLLDREVLLETKKANIRKVKTIAIPKQNQIKSKSAFDSFRDFATNFANNQKNQPSMFGDLNFGGNNGKKKNNKRSGK